MELLAPAGNFRQAYSAIESGCNALYGGLKNWSARNRAANYTFDEYNQLVTHCHNHGVRFYLTINTLLLQNELDELKEILRHPQFQKPDGILVADLGAIEFLRKEFPEISLHASTQFGAYSLEDVQFLEKHGFSRVVLARELTFNEIKYIREHTNIELEVFVYGAQCISFSGNCLWGSLLNLGSGNRGRCTGMCNDRYTYGDENSEKCHFHMEEIALYGAVKKLKEIGINSIKIEGRLRSPSEIYAVVSKFRTAIDCGIGEDENHYAGYLGGILPPEGMLPEKSSMKIGKVIICNHLKYNQMNIRLRFEYAGNVLSRIDCVNFRGEREIYELDTAKELVSGTPGKIYNYLKTIVRVNVYEVLSANSVNSEIYVNKQSLKEAAEKIQSDLFQKTEYHTAESDVPGIPGQKDIIFTDKSSDILELSAKGFRLFAFQIRNIDELNAALDIENNDGMIKIIYQLPFLDFTNLMNTVCSLLKHKAVLLTRISQIAYKEKYQFGEVYADYMINCWNTDAALYLCHLQICGIIAHPEVPAEEVEKIRRTTELSIYYIAVGAIPIGFTRACLKYSGKCNHKCNHNRSVFHNVTKGNNVEVICNNQLGYRVLLTDQIFVDPDAHYHGPGIYVLCGLKENIRKQIINGIPENTCIKIYQPW